jgi:hypothetical protein
MWVGNKNQWHPKVTALEQFLAERIIQRCDHGEVISNKHRTVNAYTQVKELIRLCQLTYKRDRTVKTLIFLLEEARSQYISQNIVKDIIVEKYFYDLKKYITDFDPKHLVSDGLANINVLKMFEHNLKIYENQLDQFYLSSLIKELSIINYNETIQIERNAKQISFLVDLIIPFFLFKGYSISSIYEVLVKWQKAGYRPTPDRIFHFFNFSNRRYFFKIQIENEIDGTEDFVDVLRKMHDGNITIESQLKIGGETSAEITLKTNERSFCRFEALSIDPQSYIRNTYDQLLKRIIIRRERPSLNVFQDYFDQVFWSFKSDGKYSKAAMNYDPINVSSRKSTYRNTLTKGTDQFGYYFADVSDIIPENETLTKVLYYYNLALGSKSIENSLALLWTALEALLPYRVSPTDITSVQHFVSNTLGIGGIARDINGFAQRFMASNKLSGNKLIPLGTAKFASCYTEKGLMQWFNWLIDDSNHETKFNGLRECSELLVFQYAKIAKPLATDKLNHISLRIKASEESIKFQLQRIYLHRNQIVHSGDLINEYSNLWLHLEWYVGKLLAYATIQLEITKKCSSLEDVFRNVEADTKYLSSYLEKNGGKLIKDAHRIHALLLKHSWQSF